MRHLLIIILTIIVLSSSEELRAQEDLSTQQTAETPFLTEPKLQLINTVELFPNPVDDYLQVKIINSELVDVKFEMHSIIGNVVQIETEEIGPDAFRIPVESFASGYYFLVVKDDATRFSRAFKFLKND